MLTGGRQTRGCRVKGGPKTPTVQLCRTAARLGSHTKPPNARRMLIAMSPSFDPTRRRLLLGAASLSAVPALIGCSTPLPMTQAPRSSALGQRRLLDSAQAHGLEAYRALTDINVAYDGQWRPLIGRIQPLVVDAGYRGPSEERLLPRLGINAQAYRGPLGRKQVLWQRGDGSRERPGESAVWFNGQPSRDRAVLDASALVAEAYGLFLLGPLWLVDRGLAAELNGTERVNGRACDVVDVWMRPGLGRVGLDRVAVCIDRDDNVTRRVRFTLEATPSTRGAVAETDSLEHQRRFGVLWPTRSYEEVVHPFRLPAHDWHITGLDVNRGHGLAELSGPEFSGAAAAPAAKL